MKMIRPRVPAGPGLETDRAIRAAAETWPRTNILDEFRALRSRRPAPRPPSRARISVLPVPGRADEQPRPWAMAHIHPRNKIHRVFPGNPTDLLELVLGLIDARDIIEATLVTVWDVESWPCFCPESLLSSPRASPAICVAAGEHQIGERSSKRQHTRAGGGRSRRNGTSIVARPPRPDVSARRSTISVSTRTSRTGFSGQPASGDRDCRARWRSETSHLS